MNKEDLIGKLQMVYVGDRNALNELIGYYDGLKQGIEELQQERNQFKEYTNHNYDKAKKYKEIIDKLKEWEQTHTILIYTKEAPRQLVGTHELLHLLYDEDKEVE